MRTAVLGVIAYVALATSIAAPSAQEVITLTTPIAHASSTTCKVRSLLVEPSMDNLSQGQITVHLYGQADDIVKVYDATTNPTGATLISQLNSANMSTTSLIKRVYQRLILDGVCSGTIGGTPQ